MQSRVLSPFVALVCLVASACQPPSETEGANGQAHANTVTVPSSIDATGETDVSAAFQNFLNQVPNDSLVELGSNARYRVEQTLLLNKRSDLTIDGNGATIFATTPGDLMRSNIHVMNSSDIAFRDLTIVGANPEGGPSDNDYDASREGQHGLRFRSVAGVTLTRIRITDTFGDFVYLGKNEENPWTSDVVIRDSSFSHSGRAGMSITGAQRVLVENNRFDEVRRSGFNFEAHYPGFAAKNVTIRNNDLGSVRLNTIAAVGMADVDDFTFHGNRLESGLRIWMHSEDGSIQHRWTITDNVGGDVVGNSNLAVMRFSHLEGLVVRGNYQAVDTWRPMVGALVDNSCDVDFDGNEYPGAAAQGTLTGACTNSILGSWSAFVRRQYLDLTDEAPTAAETQTWSNELSSWEKTKGDLVDELRRGDDNTSNVDPTVRLYRAFLGRTPDASGLEFWIGRRRSGNWTLSRIADYFADSNEFRTKYGTLTNEQFVRRIYTDVMGRDSDPEGVEFWTARLDTRSRSRGGVMVGFTESSEYKRRQAENTDVAVAYISLVGRAPTGTEERNWVTRQQAGTPNADLAQEVLTSATYASRVAG